MMFTSRFRLAAFTMFALCGVTATPAHAAPVTVDLGETRVTLEAPDDFAPTASGEHLRPPSGQMSSFLFSDWPATYLPELRLTHGDAKSFRKYVESGQRKLVDTHPMTIAGHDILVFETRLKGKASSLNFVVPSENPVQVAITLWDQDGYDIDSVRESLASLHIEAIKPLGTFDTTAFAFDAHPPFTFLMGDGRSARAKTRPGPVSETTDPRIEIFLYTDYGDSGWGQIQGLADDDTLEGRAMRTFYENLASLDIDPYSFRIVDSIDMVTLEGPATRLVATKGKATIIQYLWPSDDEGETLAGIAYGKGLYVEAADKVLRSVRMQDGS